MSGLLLGERYRLDEELGRGGMATVWRGVDLRLDRPVAVKVLDRARAAQEPVLRRLYDEARTVAKLDHPNVVGVYDFGVDDESAYLVMELVDGRDLADELSVDGALSVDRAVAIAEQVCDALAAAHAAGVVHRDIKPGNLLVSRSGTVRVCDFGVARLQARTDPTELTGTGTVAGTAGFMAPEQVTGGPVDARTDLYGLGCVLYAMLAGYPPFVADDPLTVLHQHLNQAPPRPSAERAEVPPALDRLVVDLLAKDPADRPASATEVRDRLAAVTNATAPGGAISATTTVLSVVAASAGTPRPGRWYDAAVPRRAEAGGRHREPSSLPEWVREWWVGLVSGAAILVTLLTVGLVLASADDDGDRSADARVPSESGPAETTAEPQSADTPIPTVTARTPAPSRRTDRAPADWLGTVAAAIQQQVDAGQLAPDAGRDLLRRLAEIAERQRDGKPGKSLEKHADLGKQLAELLRDGKLTQAGYDALVAATRTA